MKDYKRYTKKDYWETKSLPLNYGELITRLWILENKIENGTLIELPCKIGDTVYELERYLSCDAKDYWEIEEETFELWMLDLLGKTIFLTKSEAEDRLRELKK